MTFLILSAWYVHIKKTCHIIAILLPTGFGGSFVSHLSKYVLLTWAQPCQRLQSQLHRRAMPLLILFWVRYSEKMSKPSSGVLVWLVMECAECVYHRFLPLSEDNSHADTALTVIG